MKIMIEMDPAADADNLLRFATGLKLVATAGISLTDIGEKQEPAAEPEDNTPEPDADDDDGTPVVALTGGAYEEKLERLLREDGNKRTKSVGLSDGKRVKINDEVHDAETGELFVAVGMTRTVVVVADENDDLFAMPPERLVKVLQEPAPGGEEPTEEPAAEEPAAEEPAAEGPAAEEPAAEEPAAEEPAASGAVEDAEVIDPLSEPGEVPDDPAFLLSELRVAGQAVRTKHSVAKLVELIKAAEPTATRVGDVPNALRPGLLASFNAAVEALK